MLTYDLTETSLPLYDALYSAVKADILSGRLAPGEKLPSKRALAQHLRLSVATVQNAYAQLLAEGYLYPRKNAGISSVQSENRCLLPCRKRREKAAPIWNRRRVPFGLRIWFPTAFRPKIFRLRYGQEPCAA